METAATNAVETDAAASESTQITESAPVTPAAPAPEPAKEPEWFQKRMNELTARHYATERRAQSIEQERDRYRQELEALRTSSPEKPKTLADFEYDEAKYQAHLFEQTEKRAVEAAKRVRAEEEAQARRQSREQKWREREAAFKKDNPDYESFAYHAPVSDEVADLVTYLEPGPELAYHMGKDHEYTKMLNQLPREVAAFELGRKAAELSADKAAKAAALEKAKAEKAVSQAPPPTPKIEGSNAKVDKDPSQMSDAEFAKWRQRQIAQRRG